MFIRLDQFLNIIFTHAAFAMHPFQSNGIKEWSLFGSSFILFYLLLTALSWQSSNVSIEMLKKILYLASGNRAQMHSDAIQQYRFWAWPYMFTYMYNKMIADRNRCHQCAT